MNCVHCNKRFTCGCQKAKAADGKTVCKTCLNSYNKINTNNVSSLTKTINRAVNNISNAK